LSKRTSCNPGNEDSVEWRQSVPGDKVDHRTALRAEQERNTNHKFSATSERPAF